MCSLFFFGYTIFNFVIINVSYFFFTFSERCCQSKQLWFVFYRSLKIKRFAENKIIYSFLNLITVCIILLITEYLFTYVDNVVVSCFPYNVAINSTQVEQNSH